MVSPNSIGAAFGPGYRPVRVTLLLCGVVLLSLADLYMTLVHLMSFGMIEANPLARGIMAYGSPAALVVWKLVTVLTAVGILFYARRKASAKLNCPSPLPKRRSPSKWPAIPCCRNTRMAILSWSIANSATRCLASTGKKPPFA